MSNQIGSTIENGLSDWQILQKKEDGYAKVCLDGQYFGDENSQIDIRILNEATGTHQNTWNNVQGKKDGTWEAELRVKSGGLYRLETRLLTTGEQTGEWSPRGDMRHFWGVGDVWVIAGQSNSAGYGRGSYQDPAELGIHLLKNNEQWSLATHPMNESTNTKHPVNREASNPGHSPYLQFGRILQRALNHPIGMIQTALGGSSLNRWNPKEEGPSDLYENMLRCIKLSGGNIRGILWYQGESDVSVKTASSYANRFTDAVASWRNALNNPQLPVLTVQLNRVLGRPEADLGWSIIREAQRKVAKADPKITIVPTLDLPLSDAIHTSPSGNMLLGERLADAALEITGGEKQGYNAPDVEKISYITKQRIEIHFSHVHSYLNCIDSQLDMFLIEDEIGRIPATNIYFPNNSSIEIELARRPKGNLKVSGGWGSSPPPVALDMERRMPILSFHNVLVQ